MTDYTLTDEQMRIIYVGSNQSEEDLPGWQKPRGSDWDRWIATHDAAVVKNDLNALADDLEREMFDVLDVPVLTVGTIILALRKRAEAL